MKTLIKKTGKSESTQNNGMIFNITSRLKSVTLTSYIAVFALGISLYNAILISRQTTTAENALMTQVAGNRLNKMSQYLEYGIEHEKLQQIVKNKKSLSASQEVRFQYLNHLFDEIANKEGHLLFPIYEVIVKLVHIRIAPSSRASKITHVNKGARLRVTNEITRANKYAWFQVEYKNEFNQKIKGWAYATGTMRLVKDEDN